MITISEVAAARERVGARVHRTPAMSSARLGERVGVQLHLKCELLQKTGSFKVRGALNAIMQLPDEAKARGVVTVSAGNHAQAIAWACAASGVRATVVMPAAASRTKVAASRGYGAEVVLHGESSIEAFAKARELEEQRNLTFVHPFDDPAIIAGAGALALELLEDLPDIDTVVIPIGGGGLAAGMAVALRSLRPRLRVIGVEPEGAASMKRSLDSGQPVRLDAVRTIADGLAAPMAGDLTYPLIRDNMDDVVLVSDEEIARAMRDILVYAKQAAEPAGAAATAAVLSRRFPLSAGERIASLITGGNVDVSRLCELTAAAGAEGDHGRE